MNFQCQLELSSKSEFYHSNRSCQVFSQKQKTLTLQCRAVQEKKAQIKAAQSSKEQVMFACFRNNLAGHQGGTERGGGGV